MVHIRVVEGSDDLEDRIDTADMGEELVPKSFPFTRTFHETSNIDEFDVRRDDLCTIHDSANLLETLIIHIHDSDIWLDSTKWEIRSLGCIGSCECVEESGFTDIRETDDSDLHSVYILEVNLIDGGTIFFRWSVVRRDLIRSENRDYQDGDQIDLQDD